MKTLNKVISVLLAAGIVFSGNAVFAAQTMKYDDNKVLQSFSDDFEGYKDRTTGNGVIPDSVGKGDLGGNSTNTYNYGVNWGYDVLDNCHNDSLKLWVKKADKYSPTYRPTAFIKLADATKLHYVVSVYPYSSDVIAKLDFGYRYNDGKKNYDKTIKLAGFKNNGVIEYYSEGAGKYVKALDYEANKWYKFDIYLDSENSTYTLFINGVCYADGVNIYTDDSNTAKYFEHSGTRVGLINKYYIQASGSSADDYVTAIAIDNVLIERYETVPSPSLKAIKALSGGTAVETLADVAIGDTVKFIGENIPSEHEMIVAVYKGNSLETAIIPDKEVNVVDWTVPADKDQYNVKAMIWKNFTGLVPLTKSIDIK